MIVWINILVDILAKILAIKESSSEMLYNISAPIEQMLTIFIYSKGVNSMRIRNIHLLTISLIFLSSLSNYWFVRNPYGFHSYTIVFSGIAVATFSYWQLKFAINHEDPWRSVIFWFSLANLIYYFIMATIIVSLPLANEISNDFAASIKAINDTTYIIWSILISIGFIWNKTKNI